MATTLTPEERYLPHPSEMERDHVLELFLNVVNLCEPDHKYEIYYPLEPHRIDFSWTTKYYAKCGPRTSGGYFAINMNWLNNNTSIPRAICVMAHEIGHFKYGVTRNKSRHPPEFWDAMARYTNTLLDKWEEVNSWFGGEWLQKEWLKEAVVNDPNDYMVDGRIETVEERQRKMADKVNYEGLDL